jgi:hypothetical protein
MQDIQSKIGQLQVRPFIQYYAIPQVAPYPPVVAPVPLPPSKDTVTPWQFPDAIQVRPPQAETKPWGKLFKFNGLTVYVEPIAAK